MMDVIRNYLWMRNHEGREKQDRFLCHPMKRQLAHGNVQPFTVLCYAKVRGCTVCCTGGSAGCPLISMDSESGAPTVFIISCGHLWRMKWSGYDGFTELDDKEALGTNITTWLKRKENNKSIVIELRQEGRGRQKYIVSTVLALFEPVMHNPSLDIHWSSDVYIAQLRDVRVNEEFLHSLSHIHFSHQAGDDNYWLHVMGIEKIKTWEDVERLKSRCVYLVATNISVGKIVDDIPVSYEYEELGSCIHFGDMTVVQAHFDGPCILGDSGCMVYVDELDSGIYNSKKRVNILGTVLGSTKFPSPTVQLLSGNCRCVEQVVYIQPIYSLLNDLQCQGISHMMTPYEYEQQKQHRCEVS